MEMTLKPAAHEATAPKNMEIEADAGAATALGNVAPQAGALAEPQSAVLLVKAEPSSSKYGASEGTCAASERSGGEESWAPPPDAPRAGAGPRRGFWGTLIRYVGPGFLISMAYIDPGNLAADINQGLAAGYQLGWVTLWATAMGFVVQMLAAKLGVATGRHMAEHCRACYPPVPRLMLWALTELAIIASDMIEVIGGAAALSTLSSGAIPLWAGVLITAATAFLTLLLERSGTRRLEAVLLTTICVMSGTFGFMFFSTGVPYGQVAKGLAVPYLTAATIPYAAGSLGAIIMPHNLYLHSALVLTRGDLVNQSSVPVAMRYIRLESALALAVALVINVFITSVFANAFHGQQSQGAQDGVDLANAGALLAERYGRYMQYIWGVGLLAAANASTVTSTYAGQVVMTGYLRIRVSVWWRTAAVRLFTLGPTLLVAILLGSAASSFSSVTVWLNVMQSLVLPFAVIPLVALTSSKAVMAGHVNPRWFVVAMALVVAFLVAINGYLAVSFALGQLPHTAWARAIFGVVSCLYCLFMAYLVVGPPRCARWAGATVALLSKVQASLPPVGRAVDMMDAM